MPYPGNGIKRKIKYKAYAPAGIIKVKLGNLSLDNTQLKSAKVVIDMQTIQDLGSYAIKTNFGWK